MTIVLLILFAVIVAIWVLGVAFVAGSVLAAAYADFRDERRQRRRDHEFHLAAMDRAWGKAHKVRP